MTLSIWYFLALIPTAIGSVSVFLTRSKELIGRLEFLVRLFALCAFGVALAFILRQRDENIAAAIMVLYLLIGSYLIPYWATARLRDMRVRNKYWAVLTMVPVVGVIYTLYLLCAKGTIDLPSEADEDLPPIVPQDVLDAIETEKSDQAPRAAS
jgi:uncharacterized membrane protein YhaH (DUF805 family)